MIDWLAHPVFTALSAALLHSLWQFILLVGLAHYFAGFCPSASKRHWVYLVAIMLCPFVFGSTIFWFYPIDTATLPGQIMTANTPEIVEGIMADKVAKLTSTPTVPQLLSAAYLLVLLALLCKSALDLFRLGAVRRKSLAVPEELRNTFNRLRAQFRIPASTVLRLSGQVGSALTAGIIRPFIVLPIGLVNQLAPAEMEAILLHELAHVVRRDHLWNALQSALLQLFFYHPVVHWLSRQIDREREYACDDLVIGRVEPRLYANSLLRVARFSVTHKNRFIVQAQGKSQFTQRIQRLFASQAPRQNQRWLLLPVLLLPLLLTAVLTAQKAEAQVMEELVEQTDKSPEDPTLSFREKAIEKLRAAIPGDQADEIVYFFNNHRYAAFDDFAHLFGNNLFSEACDCDDEELLRINAEEGTNYTSIRRYFSDGVNVNELKLDPGESSIYEGVSLAEPTTVEEPGQQNLAMFINEVPIYEEPGSGSLVTLTAERATVYERDHPITKRAIRRSGLDYDGAIVMETAKTGDEATENVTAAISFNDTILVIINDQPFEDQSILQRIPPGDIATINVIKDPARLSDYGKSYKGMIDIKLKPGRSLAGEAEEPQTLELAEQPDDNHLYIINEKIYSYDPNTIERLPAEAIASVNVEKRSAEMRGYNESITTIVKVQLKAGYSAEELLPGLAKKPEDNGVEDMFGTDNVLFYVDGKITENLNFKALKKKGIESLEVIRDKDRLKALDPSGQHEAVVKIVTYKSKEQKANRSHEIELKKRKERKSSGN
ncbi:hypothetical protein CEQ90_15500 [Lewinellaceae bacterium SD302]|nr:hypothetical protein CEQ90_15500 [Lewinellaceae bacterium SD302]